MTQVPFSKELAAPFKAWGVTQTNDKFPYDPSTRRGNPDDPAHYTKRPGIDFLLPYLLVPNGPAFIWPLGIEGVDITIEPALGIHRYIGDNKVAVDVVHKGMETIEMSGSFPGDSSADAFQSLRDIVYADTPVGGKILFVPYLMPMAQRVVVQRSQFTRPQDARGNDLTYTIAFLRIGISAVAGASTGTEPTVSGPTKEPLGTSAAYVSVDGTHNTLRNIAQWKYNDATKWRTLYNLNTKLFTGVPMTQVPDYRLKLGTKVYI